MTKVLKVVEEEQKLLLNRGPELRVNETSHKNSHKKYLILPVVPSPPLPDFDSFPRIRYVIF